MVKTDCIYFPLDRPCRFHKEKGIKCSDCSRYNPICSRGRIKKVLIIKLDAMGDVLRTTFLLPGLKEKYGKSCEITWVTAPGSSAIIDSNPHVNRAWVSDRDIFSKILSEHFDEVINLDLSPQSLALATIACTSKRTGFWLDGRRKVQYSNEFARKWLFMSAFDDIKKKNTHSYQYWMSKITELRSENYEIYVPTSVDSKTKAKAFAQRFKLAGCRVVGINPGAGGRWNFKKWTDSGYLYVIRKLCARGIKVILLGGPEEKALISYLVKKSEGKAVSTGTDNALLDFFAFINLCDIVITGDTMALHAALGLGKKAAALFGPTSAAEIEMYGRGVKIVSPVSCVCCYRQSCDASPNCMKSIKPDTVLNAVGKLLDF